MNTNYPNRWNNTTKCDVTIIIPVYGVEAYIAECLQSIMSQTDIHEVAIECILVDDCSPDKSMEIAHKLIAEYDGTIVFNTIIRTHNGGLSSARNTGIKAAHGRYLFFLDSDDILSKDAISKLYDVAKKFNHAQIVTGKYVNFPGTKQIEYYQLRDVYGDQVYENKDDVRNIFLRQFPVISCNKLILKSFVIDNNLYFKEGIIHEDDNWMARAYHHIDCVAICDSVTYYYRLREGAITSQRFSRKSLLSYSDTAREMFGKAVEWDKAWMHWTLQTLDNIKLWGGENEVRHEAHRIYNELIHILLTNKNVPNKYKWIYRYHSLPRPLMRVYISYMLLNQT